MRLKARTMCGRFTQKYTWEELHRLYRLTQPARNVRPQYNICPTDPIDVIVPGNDGGLVVAMLWGLTLIILTLSGLIIYFLMHRRNLKGIQRVFW